MGRGGVGEGVGYLLTCYKEHNEMDLHASTHKGSADSVELVKNLDVILRGGIFI
jgi:hypothetical protein